MTLSFLYWFLLLVAVILGSYTGTRGDGWDWAVCGMSGLVFVLLILLGIKIFGKPIQR